MCSVYVVRACGMCVVCVVYMWCAVCGVCVVCVWCCVVCVWCGGVCLCVKCMCLPSDRTRKDTMSRAAQSALSLQSALCGRHGSSSHQFCTVAFAPAWTEELNRLVGRGTELPRATGTE